MFSFRASLGMLLMAALMASPLLGAQTHKHHTRSHTQTVSHKSSRHHVTHHARYRHTRYRRSRHHEVRGQLAIAPERVTQIQEALIREHYLAGEPSGEWDAQTKAAMVKLQADNGWQTKLTPDSRALKKLGLGPDYSNALNAKTATFTPPPPISTIPAGQAEGFADASGANR
ncbi:MAG TPA: peptidoglycan-binding protein [Terracidiphilus sp.]|nr:peptidoglycan-binding protein [Terracidiphilus sp.]